MQSFNDEIANLADNSAVEEARIQEVEAKCDRITQEQEQLQKHILFLEDELKVLEKQRMDLKTWISAKISKLEDIRRERITELERRVSYMEKKYGRVLKEDQLPPRSDAPEYQIGKDMRALTHKNETLINVKEIQKLDMLPPSNPQQQQGHQASELARLFHLLKEIAKKQEVEAAIDPKDKNLMDLFPKPEVRVISKAALIEHSFNFLFLVIALGFIVIVVLTFMYYDKWFALGGTAFLLPYVIFMLHMIPELKDVWIEKYGTNKQVPAGKVWCPALTRALVSECPISKPNALS